jgi:virulence factor Mce-like protein
MGVLSRFEQVPGRARDRNTRNGLIVLGVLIAVLYYAYTGGSIPFLPESGRTVTADFASVANVTPGKTPVRVAGVEVGKVDSVERLPNGRGVRVKMRITDDGVHLRKDATAHIYWRTLLGFAFYIQLDEGSAPQGLGGQTIAMRNTTTQVELDQVLASLRKPSREGLQTMLQEFDNGFNGESKAGRSLDALGPAMKQVAPGLDALRGTKPGDLTDTVASASRFMGALARNEVQLGQVVDHASTTLAVTAAQRAALDSTLRNGPSALEQTRRTMTRLRTTLDTLDPVADSLRPGVRVLDDAGRAVRPALAQLRPTLADARPLLADLRPALTKLGSAGRTGVPLLRRLRPTFDRLNATIIPGLNKKGATGLKLQEAVGPTIASVSSSTSLFDAYGFTQRFQAVNGGGRSAGFLPCSLGVSPVGVNCGALNAALGQFIPGLGTAPAAARRTSAKSAPSGTSASPTKTPAGASPAAKTIARLTGLLGG